MIPQALVVEEDGGHDKRAREASPPCLVRARDVTNAEAPVEAEQFLAGPPHGHAEYGLGPLLLADARLPPHLLAKVVELCAPDVPDGHHLDPLDLG